MDANRVTCPHCGAESSARATLCFNCSQDLSTAPSVPARGSGFQQQFKRTTYGETVQYDPAVIRGFAARLYRMASLIALLYTAGGALIGLTALGTMGALFNGSGSEWLMGVVVGGGLGYLVGNMVASRLRLEAQVALCQVEIEHNTRS